MITDHLMKRQSGEYDPEVVKRLKLENCSMSDEYMHIFLAFSLPFLTSLVPMGSPMFCRHCIYIQPEQVRQLSGTFFVNERGASELRYFYVFTYLTLMSDMKNV